MQAQCAEALAECTARQGEARRARANYQATVRARASAPSLSRAPRPVVVLQRSQTGPKLTPAASLGVASTVPSCAPDVGSEAWRRELELVRRGSAPVFAGVSSSEDVIPRR
ncbi:hypothetical protein J2X02_003479 [Pseudoxanthomonas japonensis]|nr:hypothetical protein [Pseudoxanthomonas japonensis]